MCQRVQWSLSENSLEFPNPVSQNQECIYLRVVFLVQVQRSFTMHQMSVCGSQWPGITGMCITDPPIIDLSPGERPDQKHGALSWTPTWLLLKGKRMSGPSQPCECQPRIHPFLLETFQRAKRSPVLEDGKICTNCVYGNGTTPTSCVCENPPFSVSAKCALKVLGSQNLGPSWHFSRRVRQVQWRVRYGQRMWCGWGHLLSSMFRAWSEIETWRILIVQAGVSQWGKNKVLPSCTSRLAQLTTASGTPTHSCVKTGRDFGKLLISHITASSLVLKGLWMFRLCTGGLQVQAWDVAQRFISDLFKYFISDVSGATEREKATEILQRSEPAAAYFPMSQWPRNRYNTLYTCHSKRHHLSSLSVSILSVARLCSFPQECGRFPNSRHFDWGLEISSRSAVFL